MAIIGSVVEHPIWSKPSWPERLPAGDTLRAAYGRAADELTIRFAGEPRRDLVTLYVATPDIEYAAMIVRWDSGEVVGIQIDYLSDYAVRLHPQWLAAMAPEPKPEQLRSIVTEIKELYETYGTNFDNSEVT